MTLRIALSTLAAMGAIAIGQTIAPAQDSDGKDSGDAFEFGQLVDPSSEDSANDGGQLEPMAVGGCPDGNVCFWKQKDFDGDRETADASFALEDRYLGPYDRSSKNRFGSRKVVIKDFNFQVVDCINAGGQRDNLVASADIFRIGGVGSSC